MKGEQEKLHSGNINGVKRQVLATDQKLGVRLWEESPTAFVGDKGELK